MTDTTPRAGAPLLGASQAQKHVTHNEALYQFDALLNPRILDRDLSAPPASPADGDTYLVKATGSGAWTGQSGRIAYCADGSWRFYAPFAGLVAYVADEAALIVFDGANWTDYGALIALQNVPELGVNTAADATNKLSVKSESALFCAIAAADGGSGDVRLTVNKETAADSATLLFQDGASGRAELGLAADDDFHMKVSADGATWTEALRLQASSGQVILPKGQLKFPATANPSTDANTLDDYREGTWTPTISFNTPGTSSFSYSVQTGLFTRIGNLVHLEFQITFSPTIGTGSGGLKIGGIPYTANSNLFPAGNLSLISANFNWPAGYTMLSIGMWDSGHLYIAASKSAGGQSSIQSGNLTNGAAHTIVGSIDYLAL